MSRFMEVSKINRIKKYRFGVELSSCELNLVLIETTMIDCDKFATRPSS